MMWSRCALRPRAAARHRLSARNGRYSPASELVRAATAAGVTSPAPAGCASIRRRTGRHAPGQRRPAGARRRRRRVTPTGQIGPRPQRHAARPTAPICACLASCSSSCHYTPAVEIGCAPILPRRTSGHPRGVRVAKSRPARCAASSPAPVGQRAPGGERIQRGALARVGRRRTPPTGRAGGPRPFSARAPWPSRNCSGPIPSRLPTSRASAHATARTSSRLGRSSAYSRDSLDAQYSGRQSAARWAG